jgi:hypothetical protein
VTIFFGAFQSSQQFGDIYAMLGLGLVGWLMKQLGWPRAPFLVGFVLTKPTEQYLWLSISRYDLAWLWRPGVIALGLLLIASIVWVAWGKRGAEGLGAEESGEGRNLLGKTPSLVFNAIALLVFAAALYEARSFPYLGAIFPVAATLPAVLMAAAQILLELRAPEEPVDAPTRKRTKSALAYFLSLVAFLVMIVLIGFGAASALFTFAFLFFSVRMRWFSALAYSTIVVGLAVLMSQLLGLYWPEGLLVASWQR